MELYLDPALWVMLENKQLVHSLVGKPCSEASVDPADTTPPAP